MAFQFVNEEERQDALDNTRGGGTYCPKCQSLDYYAENLEGEGTWAIQWFSCERDGVGCGAEWCEIYDLVRIGTRADYE